MCGILGYVGDFEQVDFQNALHRLTHRGPDGFGIWKEEDVVLGHRRLSILDLSDNGKQPMTLWDRYIITFNGEIYNYLELKKELIGFGFQFTSHSDTEVLLYAFVKWGVACLDKLNGMWAFAIWDKLETTLFLSRDRIGEKPLFYAHDSRGIVFASEKKAIYPFLKNGIQVDDNQVFLAKKRVFEQENSRDTYIVGISKLPAGHFALLKENKIHISSYWKLEDQVKPFKGTYRQAVEEFRALFLDSCKLRMRSDVPLGTALSGGLDSSATLASMKYLANSRENVQTNWQHAFVACFKGSEIDERRYAKRVTDHLGIQATFLEIDPLKDIEQLEYQLYQFEEIYFTSPIPFTQIYGQIRKDGVRVTLDGHGADELFAGYSFALRPALIDAPFWKWKEILGIIYPESPWYEISPEKWGTLKFALLNRYPFLKKRGNIYDEIHKSSSLDFMNSELLQQTTHTVLPTLLRNYDRYAMMNGVEIRMPFLDYRLMEFAFSIPYSYKIRNGYTKAIIRDAVKDLLPEEIVYRKNKIGFNSPNHDWLNGPLNEWFKDIVNSKTVTECTFLTKEEKIFLVAATGKKVSNFNEGEYIWKLLLLAIWNKSLNYAT